MKSAINLNDNKTRALNAALSQIERQFGKGSVMKMGDVSQMKVDTVSS